MNDTSTTTPAMKRVRNFRLPTGVLGTCLGETDNSVYAACCDGVYKIDLESSEQSKLFQHESYASSVVYARRLGQIISAGYDGWIKWFDLEKQSIVRELKAHDFWSWQMAVSPDGERIASVTGQYLAGGYKYEPKPESEPSVKVWDAATGEMIHALSAVPSVQAVTFSPDSRHVAAGNLMGEIRIWDVESGDLVANWTTGDLTSWGIIKNHCYCGGIFALEFNRSGDQLLAAGMGHMRDPIAGNGRQLWQRFAWMEIPARKIDETVRKESGEGLMETLAYHPSEEFFLMGGRLRGGKWNTALFDHQSGRRIHSMNTGYRMTDSQFTGDGTRLLIGGCYKQKWKDEKFEPWGALQIYKV